MNVNTLGSQKKDYDYIVSYKWLMIIAKLINIARFNVLIYFGTPNTIIHNNKIAINFNCNHGQKVVV